MSEKPAQPADTDAPGEGAADGSSSISDPRERIGELVVERMVKEDGRALIAYWHSSPRT